MAAWYSDDIPEGPDWPMDANDIRMDGVFLVSVADDLAYSEALLFKLRTAGIPTVARKHGGVPLIRRSAESQHFDIMFYVPASHLAEAQALIQSNTGDEPEEEEL